MEFKDKVALITGGTSGIGAATARLLAKEGAKVAIVGRNKEKGVSTVKEIQLDGGDALFLQADVSRPSDARKIVEETVKHFGRLDILFNNAGVELLADVVNTTYEDLRKVVDVDLIGTFLVSQFAIPHLRKRRGVIINNSSGAGLVGGRGIAAYSAAKGGVIAFTKALAAECAPDIRVNCVCPGYIKTPMHDRAEGRDEAFDTEVIPKIVPLQRIGKPEEVAYAVLFLASDKAAYITGVALAIDGGLGSLRSREA